MMDAASVGSVVTAMEALAKIVNSLGVGGVLALLLVWPVLFTTAVLGIMIWVNVKLSGLLDTYRTDMAKQIEEHRVRVDGILQKHGEGLNTVTQYYNNNVELLKITQKMADDLQDVVLMNAKNCEAMSEKIRNNHFCPAVRRNSGGEG